MIESLIERTARSWRLVKASIAVLNSDGELIFLPMISGIVTALVVAGFVAQAMSDGTFETLRNGESLDALQSYYGWLLAFYVVQYFVIIFFNTALVGAALERMNGGDPTIRSALALALRRIGPILGYAIISATVGVLLRMLSERLGIVGRLLGAGAGIAWTLATFLVVPILAAEGLGPIEAIEKSGSLLRRSWGENLIGNAGISFVLGAFAVVAAFIGLSGNALLGHGFETLGLVLMALGAMLFLAAILLGAALSGVYAAAVYTYAVSGKPPAGFDRDLIHDAFTPKG